MRTVVLLASIAAAVALCGCQSVVFSPEVDELIVKIRMAKDPNGVLQRVDTKVVKGTFRTDTKRKPMPMTLTFKKPGKMRVDVETPSGKFVKVYDGKTGWSFFPGNKLKILSGTALDETKLQAKLLSPGMKLSEIFETIKLDGESEVAGRKCYKLVGQPKKIFNSDPISIFVDKETNLILKREEVIHTAKGKRLQVSTLFNDYRSAGGVMMARNIISYVEDDIAEFNVDSVVWDENVNDSFFSVPSKL